MLTYTWPFALIVVSNTIYQICTKSVPNGMHPLASLTVTYLVGAAATLILYYALNRDGNIFAELRLTNWAPVLLGFVIVGLEVGYIYAYQAGWSVSILPIVQGAVLAVLLIFVGYLLYQEKITWNKVVGIFVCIGGMALIGLK